MTVGRPDLGGSPFDRDDVLPPPKENFRKSLSWDWRALEGRGMVKEPDECP